MRSGIWFPEPGADWTNGRVTTLCDGGRAQREAA